METALYFPYIRVPETPWFSQVLLYWDAAAAIVPGNMRDYEAQLGRYMSELVRTHLVRPIRPERIFDSSSEFDDRFLAMLDTYEFPDASRLTPDFLQVRLHQWRWTRLHAQEASRRLFSELEARGLAAHQGYDEDHTAEWWAVENETASLYMAYLVGSVCREDNSLFPVTDTRDTLLSLTVSGDDDVASRLRALRYAAITRALPVPSRLVPADELLSFKDRYADLLNRLRHYLNGQLVDLAMIDDDFARNAKTEGTLQNIHDDVAVLTEQMHKRRWPRIMLAGVGGLTASALTIGTAVSSGGSALALGLGITSGLVSMGPAGYQVADFIRSPRIDEHSPLAYAALAEAL